MMTPAPISRERLTEVTAALLTVNHAAAFLRRIVLNYGSKIGIGKNELNRTLQLEDLTFWRPLVELDGLHSWILRTNYTFLVID